MKNDTGFPLGEPKPKPFEDLTFHDDFMFGIVMQDREICREALECMLGMRIARVDYAEPQRVLDPLYTVHGIRLDVYVQTDEAESEFTRRLREMVEAQKQIEGTKKLYFSWSLHDYDVRNEGIAIGEKRGEKRGKREAARILKNSAVDRELIAKATGLSVEEIEKL